MCHGGENIYLYIYITESENKFRQKTKIQLNPQLWSISKQL